MSEFSTARVVNAIGRARQILSDPNRIVLDPMHYTEVGIDGEQCFFSFEEALEKRDSCRVCFMGACGLAAIESIAFETPEDCEWPAECAETLEEHVAKLLTAKAVELGIPLNLKAIARWGNNPDNPGDPDNLDASVVLTSALIAGRAVEVCDAVISDLTD